MKKGYTARVPPFDRISTDRRLIFVWRRLTSFIGCSRAQANKIPSCELIPYYFPQPFLAYLGLTENSPAPMSRSPLFGTRYCPHAHGLDFFCLVTFPCSCILVVTIGVRMTINVVINELTIIGFVPIEQQITSEDTASRLAGFFF